MDPRTMRALMEALAAAEARDEADRPARPMPAAPMLSPAEEFAAKGDQGVMGMGQNLDLRKRMFPTETLQEMQHRFLIPRGRPDPLVVPQGGPMPPEVRDAIIRSLNMQRGVGL